MQTWSFGDGGWREGDLEGASLRWFDLVGADPALEELADRFALHPLAIEDCRSPNLHTPKVDEFSGYVFVVLLSATAAAAERVDMGVEELDVFLGRDFIVTFQDRPLPEIERVRSELRSGVSVRPGTDGLLYEIADRVVDELLPEVDAIAERLEGFEEDVLVKPDRAAYSRLIVQLRGQTGHLRRLLSPQLLVMQRLARGEFALVSEANRVYFRDVYDHMQRVDMALEGVRDDAEVVLSTYLSALNNQMNQVMKVLSIVAALALPATVISGVFGTNFDDIPGLHSSWGFGLMLAAMAGVMGAMLTYFWRRRWF